MTTKPIPSSRWRSLHDAIASGCEAIHVDKSYELEDPLELAIEVRDKLDLTFAMGVVISAKSGAFLEPDTDQAGKYRSLISLQDAKNVTVDAEFS